MNFKQLAQALATAAALLIAQPIQAETFYFHNDHLGTPQALTDDSGTVVWQGSYSPFGEVTETTDTVEQNIRFPGQYFEEETGLHYNYFRDYDPTTGRYIESDPIGLGGGVNTFGYVNGQPISRVDPLGLLDGCPNGNRPNKDKMCVPYDGRDPMYCPGGECASMSPDFNCACMDKCLEKKRKVSWACRGAGNANIALGKMCEQVMNISCSYSCKGKCDGFEHMDWGKPSDGGNSCSI